MTSSLVPYQHSLIKYAKIDTKLLQRIYVYMFPKRSFILTEQSLYIESYSKNIVLELIVNQEIIPSNYQINYR